MTQTQENISKKLDELMDEIVDTVLNTGGRMMDFYGIGEKEAEALYSVAYNMYKTGQFEKALKVFKVLCFLNHMEPKYWFSLGATHHRLKNLDMAARAYAYTSILDPENPTPALHAAECLMALGRKDEAEGALLTAIEFSQEGGKYQKERERAKMLLDMLKKEEKKDE
ncbi:SycD/LcrH family type III secretion system chaperone [Desulfothermus sp.]